MPNFDIVKKTDVENTYRVARIIADFDLKPEHSGERFAGNIIFSDDWQIGVIVGASGTGKTTIAKQLWQKEIDNNFSYTHKSVVDDMPQSASIDEIEKMFYSVGFGSTPSWLKPYSVLSNGEKMRVDLARAMLEKDFIVFDEFTSVVDRNVAQTACIAINKAIKSTNKKFIAITCHYDVLEWIQADWVFDTNEMKSFFGKSRVQKNAFTLKDVNAANGKNLSVITI